MNVLVTAGNTQAPIDRVRCLTNVFTGRTGAGIAREARRRGHRVTLLTSQPETAAGSLDGLHIYRTFDDLHALLEQHVRAGGFDALVHCAAVSDYRAAGVFAPAPGTHFEPEQLAWHATDGPPTLRDRSAGKVKSDEPELWLRLVRTPKLIDQFRRPWGFRGILVKFKLEVDVSDEQLLAVAERSRRQSDADWMVANTLDGAATYAYLGSAAGYRRLDRAELAPCLLDVLEQHHREATHG